MKKIALSVLALMLQVFLPLAAQHAGKPGKVPMHYTYTDAADDGFVGSVHTVRTVTTLCDDTFIAIHKGETYAEYTPGGMLSFMKVPGAGIACFTGPYRLFSRRALEGRVYNVPNAARGTLLNYFCISYDIMLMHGVPYPNIGTARYTQDGNGLPASATMSARGGSTLVWRRNDAEGRVDRLQDNIPLVRIKYGQDGRLRRASRYSVDGDLIDQATYEWPDSNTMRVRTSGMINQPSDFVFDENGRVLSVSGWAGSSVESPRHTYTYQYEGGLLVREDYSREDREYARTFMLNYDRRGNVVRYEKVVSKGVFCAMHSSTPFEKIVYTFRYTYNRQGDWIRRTCYRVYTGDIDIELEIFNQTREITYH